MKRTLVSFYIVVFVCVCIPPRLAKKLYSLRGVIQEVEPPSLILMGDKLESNIKKVLWRQQGRGLTLLFGDMERIAIAQGYRGA